jgi:hypothetical protein
MTNTRSFLLFGVLLASCVPFSACGSGQNQGGFIPPPPAEDSGAEAAPPAMDSGEASDDAPSLQTTHDDFHDPVIDTGAPAASPQLFAAADKAPDGPCMYEPEVGSLFPKSWLRPRFRFTLSHQENLFEIKLVVPNETDPLTIYTTKNGYAIDAMTWKTIGGVGAGAPIHVTVRSATIDAHGALTGGPWKGTEGDIQVAPVMSGGSIVYWTTSNGTVLKGFRIGDESVQSVITPKQEGSQCIACHSSTPDGQYVALTTSSDPKLTNTTASVDLRSVDGNATRPAFASLSAALLLGRNNQQAAVFSKSHWVTGDRVALSMLAIGSRTEIVWTDLEQQSNAMGQGWGVIARGGDPNDAASAAFSHDGVSIAYTSATSVDSGTTTPDGLIYTVPFNYKQGGSAKPVTGASDAAYMQYYPQFSPDDQLIAFNRVPKGSGSSYNNAAAEVYVVPAGGGTPTRLAANDPASCTGAKSPGLHNSWPKWAPQAATADGKTYYFLVFSSTRDPAAAGAPQLYAAPIVVDASGKVTTYPALYFWNQPETEHNHTPVWDMLQLPAQ